MKSILSFNLFHLIQEAQAYDYKRRMNEVGSIKYKFNADDITYFVNIWHDESTNSFGEYEVEFGFEGQKHSGDTTKKDLKHLNSVLTTVCEILEDEVKDKNIKNIKIQGAQGEGDEGGLFNDTLRAKIYYRFLSNRYGKEGVNQYGGYINLDMTKILPEVFEGDKDISKKDLILNELLRINDFPENIDGIKRGINGVNDTQFNVSTDFIDNEEKGGILIEIDVWDNTNEYNIHWELLDEGEEGDEFFDSFEDLLSFLKKFPS